MEQEKNTLTVLEIAPGQYPKQVEIDPDLKALQQAVGGNAVQAAHAIVISCHCKFLTFIIKVGIGFISLSKNVRQWLGL